MSTIMNVLNLGERNNFHCSVCSRTLRKRDAVNHWHCDQCATSPPFTTNSTASRDKHINLTHSIVHCACSESLPLLAIPSHVSTVITSLLSDDASYKLKDNPHNAKDEFFLFVFFLVFFFFLVKYLFLLCEIKSLALSLFSIMLDRAAVHALDVSWCRPVLSAVLYVAFVAFSPRWAPLRRIFAIDMQD
jgi:hypothetical protein